MDAGGKGSQDDRTSFHNSDFMKDGLQSFCCSGRRRDEMTRSLLDAQLHDITTKIIQLGTLVENQLEHSLQAVNNNDLSQCGLVIASDTKIDDLRAEVERLAFRSLTLQQPLAGSDLRLLSSAPSIAADLERAGDNAAGLATLLVRMAPLRTEALKRGPTVNTQGGKKASPTEASIVTGILDLGQEAHRVLHATMRAFETQDAEAARSIWQEDDVVDVRYHLVRHEIMTMFTAVHAIAAMQQDARIMQRMTYWLWIAHNLERVGDHCTNVCERLVFVLEGETAIEPSEE
jgi:phosphate transport system protein